MNKVKDFVVEKPSRATRLFDKLVEKHPAERSKSVKDRSGLYLSNPRHRLDRLLKIDGKDGEGAFLTG